MRDAEAEVRRVDEAARADDGGVAGGLGDGIERDPGRPEPLRVDEHLELPITLYEAVLGAKVRVPTLVGAVELAMPRGTSSVLTPFTRTMMVTHANGSSGYLPDDDAYKNVSYEIVTSRVKPGCAEAAIVNGLVEMIERQ